MFTGNYLEWWTMTLDNIGLSNKKHSASCGVHLNELFVKEFLDGFKTSQGIVNALGYLSLSTR